MGSGLKIAQRVRRVVVGLARRDKEGQSQPSQTPDADDRYSPLFASHFQWILMRTALVD